MHPLSPVLLVTTAVSYIGLGEEIACPPGRTVETMLRQVGRPNGPWDAAFVHHVGYWTHYDLDTGSSSWPFDPVAHAQDLALMARQQRVLTTVPSYGDLFLLWSAAAKEFSRTGIVVKVRGEGRFANGTPFLDCLTLEGNTGPAGRPGGPSVMCIERALSPDRGDRFVHWADLDPRGDVSSVKGNAATRNAKLRAA